MSLQVKAKREREATWKAKKRAVLDLHVQALWNEYIARSGLSKNDGARTGLRAVL